MAADIREASRLNLASAAEVDAAWAVLDAAADSATAGGEEAATAARELETAVVSLGEVWSAKLTHGAAATIAAAGQRQEKRQAEMEEAQIQAEAEELMERDWLLTPPRAHRPQPEEQPAYTPPQPQHQPAPRPPTMSHPQPQSPAHVREESPLRQAAPAETIVSPARQYKQMYRQQQEKRVVRKAVRSPPRPFSKAILRPDAHAVGWVACSMRGARAAGTRQRVPCFAAAAHAAPAAGPRLRTHHPARSSSRRRRQDSLAFRLLWHDRR